MLHTALRIPASIALSLAVVVAAGCSKSPAGPFAEATNENAGKAALSNAVANANKGSTPTPCETDFSARDAAEILTGSTALNRYAMNAALGEAENGCEFGDGNGALIDFAIRAKPPMQGDNRQQYKTLTSFLQPKGVPFAGVGDQAVWVDVHDSNIPGMSEFDTYAIKGEVICLADLHFRKGTQGEKAITPARGEELAKKLGALCNKSFAARGA
ncbi:hypothetical protein [Rudaea sp.]|uniref:hypothetical protein n=1 Tax=Rudaea sp. TaxID=2136325 RepID=UPI00321FA5F4